MISFLLRVKLKLPQKGTRRKLYTPLIHKPLVCPQVEIRERMAGHWK